jgi:predicted Ser/Thr protein kinase
MVDREDTRMPEGLPLQPGDPAELGGHRLLRRLGEGNQGVVFLGRSPSGEQVAIKLLHARMANDPGARDRFMRELSAAKKVARFCTAQVLDADLAGDHPYIVSEYVDGRPLRERILAEGPRTGGALERLAIGTLTALAAIHRAGVVHRDFNPHNVLLGPDGPRVIDFGIARALGATGTHESNRAGTPSYMAPEQVADGEIGPPADMFAWGSTIVFAGTGRPPFGNDSVHAVMERILREEPDLSALPEPLRSVVAACLAKDPARRPTAQQAQAGLLGHESGAMAEALMPPPAFGATPGAVTGTAEPGPTGTAEPGPTAATTASAAAAGAAGTPVARPGAQPGVMAATGGPGTRRPALRWAVVAGVAVVAAGAAVAVPLWPDGGDAATAPRVRAAETPATSPTPTPTPSARQPQLTGVRSGVPRPTASKEKPAEGCRDYRRAYSVTSAGSALLTVSVCRSGYTGAAALADSAPKDGWDICLQLRGHIAGTPAVFVSTVVSSRDGLVRGFDNGPKARYGAKTTRTEDFVKVNVGRCRGSGGNLQTSWQSKDRLATG